MNKEPFRWIYKRFKKKNKSLSLTNTWFKRYLVKTDFYFTSKVLLLLLLCWSFSFQPNPLADFFIAFIVCVPILALFRLHWTSLVWLKPWLSRFKALPRSITYHYYSTLLVCITRILNLVEIRSHRHWRVTLLPIHILCSHLRRWKALRQSLSCKESLKRFTTLKQRL